MLNVERLTLNDLSEKKQIVFQGVAKKGGYVAV